MADAEQVYSRIYLEAIKPLMEECDRYGKGERDTHILKFGGALHTAITDLVRERDSAREIVDEYIRIGSIEECQENRGNGAFAREVVSYTSKGRAALIAAVESQGIPRHECERWEDSRLRDHLITCAVVRHERRTQPSTRQANSEAK